MLRLQTLFNSFLFNYFLFIQKNGSFGDSEAEGSELFLSYQQNKKNADAGAIKEENKNIRKHSANETTKTSSFMKDLTHNFQIDFENITPFIYLNAHNGSTTYCESKIFPKPLNLSNIRHILYRSHIIYDRDNFYLSDIITKSSINMGKCSLLFGSTNFI